MEDRDKVFDEKCKELQHVYRLHTFSYDRITDEWTIQSAESNGDDRLTSKRKTISAALRKDIVNELRHELEDALFIQVQSMKDYFIE